MGKLIVIEGLDGSGKSTQWELLRARLQSAAFVTFPDYDSDSGRLISRYLAGELGESGGNPYAASSLYAADRFVSYNTGDWGRTLREGGTVICARYTSSNAVYQMAKLPESQWEDFLAWLFDYEHEKLQIPRPDLTLFLDLPLAISRELLRKRATTNDIHESDAAYRERCSHAAEFVAVRERWTRIDCTDSAGNLRAPEQINDDLARAVSEVL
jgi:dTMP kinase